MEIRARFVLVGLFVLVVIAAGFGFVYWLENAAGLSERTSYRVRFDQPVSGLLLGSAVQFNGISVGEVTDLRLNPDNPGEVLATIAVKSDTPIRSDTHVGLSFGGLTGVAEIALTGGAPSAPPVTAATDGGPPLLVADKDAGKDWTEAARDVFAQASGVLSDNADALKNTIGNLDTFSQALAKNSDKLSGLIDGLTRLTGGGAAATPPNVINLAAPTGFPPLAKAPAGQLVVARPTGPVAFETQRILVQSANGIAPAFDGSQWSDSIPLLVEAALVQSFENAGYPRVGGDTSGLAFDHQLLIELRAFEIDSQGAPQADVDLTAKLVDSTGAILATRRFEAHAPVGAMEPAAATAALNAAFDEAATAIVGWTLGLI